MPGRYRKDYLIVAKTEGSSYLIAAIVAGRFKSAVVPKLDIGSLAGKCRNPTLARHGRMQDV